VPAERKYIYFKSCVDLSGDDVDYLNEMKEMAQDVGYDTMLKHC